MTKQLTQARTTVTTVLPRVTKKNLNASENYHSKALHFLRKVAFIAPGTFMVLNFLIALFIFIRQAF